MNTRFDDFGYITKNQGKDGYLSSDRHNKIGDDDIFMIKRISTSLPILVFDSGTKNRISSATILITPKGGEQEAQVSDALGLGKLIIRSAAGYSFIITKV